MSLALSEATAFGCSSYGAWIELTKYMSGAEKYEPGAYRAIYSTSICDYFIMSHPLNLWELLLHRIEGVEIGVAGAFALAAQCHT